MLELELKFTALQAPLVIALVGGAFVDRRISSYTITSTNDGEFQLDLNFESALDIWKLSAKWAELTAEKPKKVRKYKRYPKKS